MGQRSIDRGSHDYWTPSGINAIPETGAEGGIRRPSRRRWRREDRRRE
jgi:hypothetical protein